MLFLSLARGAKVAQSCLFQMSAAILADNRQFGISLDQIDALRTRLAPTRRTFEAFARAGRAEPPLPRLNLLTNIRCPHERVCNLLRQMLVRIEKLIATFTQDDDGLWGLIDVQAGMQAAFDELDGALKNAPERPADAVQAAPDWHGKHGLTIGDLVKDYLESLKARVAAGTYGAHSFSHVQRDLRLFEDTYPAKPVVALRQHDLTRFIEMNTTWKSFWTKKRAVNAIVGCFRWCAENELIPRCPFRSPSTLRGGVHTVRRPVEDFEYIKIMRRGPRPLRRILFFLRHTGARTIEARETEWKDCHLDGPVKFIELVKHKSAHKTGLSRKIGLDAQTTRFLLNLRRQSTGTGHVFTNCDGTPWTRHSLARIVRRLAKRIGLDEGVQHRLSAYGLRHAYACNAIEAGISAKMVADQLGQADTRMLETIYASHTKNRQKHLHNVAGKISKAIKDKKKDDAAETP